jgi:hypothetical protein
MKLNLDLLLLLLVLFWAESSLYFIPLLNETLAINVSHKLLHHLEGIIVLFELNPPAFVLLIIDDGLVAFCLYFPENLEGLIIPEALEFHVEIVIGSELENQCFLFCVFLLKIALRLGREGATVPKLVLLTSLNELLLPGLSSRTKLRATSSLPSAATAAPSIASSESSSLRLITTSPISATASASLPRGAATSTAAIPSVSIAASATSSIAASATTATSLLLVPTFLLSTRTIAVV